MVRVAFFFFLLAIVAGVFGFTDIARASATIAKTLFFVFLLAWIVLLAIGTAIIRSL